MTRECRSGVAGLDAGLAEPATPARREPIGEYHRTFWTLVEDAARHRPDAVVLADGYGRSLTTTALRAEAERAAAGLLALG
ncbi:MAG: hypothetical protein ACQSGP_27710, partial [Frankia sp.]